MPRLGGRQPCAASPRAACLGCAVHPHPRVPWPHACVRSLQLILWHSLYTITHVSSCLHVPCAPPVGQHLAAVLSQMSSLGGEEGLAPLYYCWPALPPPNKCQRPVAHDALSPAVPLLRHLPCCNVLGQQLQARADGAKWCRVYTACYASPEQLLGYPGKPADVWAVGRTLLAVLTGKNALAYVQKAQIESWAMVGAPPVSTAAVSHNILQNIFRIPCNLQHLTCGTAASFAPGSAHACNRHPWNAGVWHHRGGPTVSLTRQCAVQAMLAPHRCMWAPTIRLAADTGCVRVCVCGSPRRAGCSRRRRSSAA